MTATIKDVAARARVSTATVSRVLSDSARVLPDTRRRVLEAVRALDYRPSEVARSLRRQSTAVVGLVVSDISNPFYPEVVRGIEDETHRQGRSLLLGNTAGSEEREAAYLDLLVERRVDAVIVASERLARRQATRLASYSRPVVLVNVAPGRVDLPAVLSDNRLGGRLASRHLLDCGYQRLVYIAGPAKSGKGSERHQGVLEGARGREVEVVAGGGDLAGGAEAMQELVGRIDPPYGVAAHNDLTAVGALSALRALGIRVPEEVGVVGFDNVALSAYLSPALTTVAQDNYGMGRRAAQMVDELLAGGRPTGTERLPVHLVERDSTIPGVR